ncbi:MAG: hypothetical protein NQ127_01695 [Candidatus Cardinium sp.]|nr:hypothetical protein [Candidatus Cardinium sp.]
MYQNRQQVNLKKGIVYVWFLFTVVFAGSCEEFGTASTGKAEERKAVAVRSGIAKRVAAAIEADPAIANIKAALAKGAAAVAGRRGGTDLSIANIKAELAKRKAEVTAREAEKIAMVLTRQSVIRATEAVVERIRKANPNKVTSKVVTEIAAVAKRNIEGNAYEQASVICGICSGGVVFEAFEQAVKAIVEADPGVAKTKEAIAKEVKEKAAEAEYSVRQVIKEEMVGAALREIVEAAGGGIKEKVLREVVKELETGVYFREMEADAIVEAAMGNPARVKERSAAAAEGVWKDIACWLASKKRGGES